MEYREYHRMTARRPALELMLLGVLIGFLLAGGLSLIKLVCEVLA